MILRRISFILLALIVPILLIILIGGVMAEEAAPEMLSLSVNPVSSTPVPAGDPAVFKVVLDNMNGQNQANMFLELNWDKEIIQRARVEVVEDETGKVFTQGIRRTEGKARWQGGIKSDGQLTLLVTLLPAACYEKSITVDLSAAAGKQSGGSTLTAKDSLQVECPANSITAEDIIFTSQIDAFSPLGVYDTTADLLKGQQAPLRLQLTNDSKEPLNALVTGILEPKAGQEADCAIVASELQLQTEGAPTLSFDRGYLPPSLSSAQMNAQPYVGLMIVELAPGDTWTADLRLPLRGRIPGCEFSGIAKVYPAPADPIPGSCDGESPQCRYRGWTTRARDLQRLFTILKAYDSNKINARVVAPDLGDAPATENNFENKSMTAYSGIKADFPTVYNFNIGFPPELQNSNGLAADHREAPLHIQAQPLRLGNLVSIEREADINPNRNLNPARDKANLDYRDDGWPRGALPASCAPFDHKVRITVEDWAVDHFQKNGGTAYLNIFADANGDGDWEDTTSCGAETVAEHIFINLPILITDLGAGQHEIELPPNPGINWETDGIWLRVTLSDQPAPLPLKTGNIAHGDGRGPAAGYFLGETEDYRLRIPENSAESVELAAASGPDLAVRLDGEMNFFAFPVDHGQSLFSIKETNNCLTCICAHIVTELYMNIGNLGAVPARGSSLLLLPDPSLRDNEIEFTVKGDLSWMEHEMESHFICGTDDPSCRLEVDLGDVPPGEFGSLIVSAALTCHESVEGCKQTEFLAKATVSTSDDDVDPGNNQASKRWKLALPPDMMIQPNITSPVPGTMSGSDLVIEGTGAIQPGGKIDVYLNGQKRGSGIAGNDNEWRVELDDVVEMYEADSFQLAVGFDLPGNLKNRTRPMTVIVDDTGMFHSGLSLKAAYVMDGKRFDFTPWDETGRVDTSGWQIPLLTGVATDVEVEPHYWCLTCILKLDMMDIALKINDNKVLAELTDPDGDGTYNGRFTPDKEDLGQPLTLHITSEGVEQIFEGRSVAVETLPKLIDGKSGQPLANQKVTLWKAARVTGGQILWERPLTVNGQPNPRLTAEDGSFFFNVAPGVYRLQVNNGSFHDGQFTEPQRLFGIYPSRNLVVNRPEFGGGLQSVGGQDMTVSIGADGFNPPFITAQTGDVLTFQNVSLQSRGLINEEAGIDSGFLPAGGTFALSFDKPGSFELADPQDPQNTAVVTITPDPAGGNVFLPVVLRP